MRRTAVIFVFWASLLAMCDLFAQSASLFPCRNIAHLQGLRELNARGIMLCPGGKIIAGVNPNQRYSNFKFIYNNFDCDTILVFTTNTAGVYDQNHDQYFSNYFILRGKVGQQETAFPVINTDDIHGLVTIINQSCTPICFGNACL